MTKIVTFADGSPLAAADLNKLSPIISDTPANLDTGTTDLYPGRLGLTTDINGLFTYTAAGTWQPVVPDILTGTMNLVIGAIPAVSSGDAQSVVFPRSMRNVPKIFVQFRNNNISLVNSISGVTTNGFTIRPRNTGSTAFGGTAGVTTIPLDWIAFAA